MDRKLRFTGSLVVLLLAGSAGAAEQSGNAALRVDGDDPRCSDETGKPFCTVGAAVRAANTRPGPDTIELAENQIFTLSQPETLNAAEGDSGLPAIASDITVHGHGATLERSRANLTPLFRLLWVNADASLTVDNLTIHGGRTPHGLDGAGLYNLGRTRLERVTFTGNVSGDDGGAIRNDGQLDLVDCTLSYNNASGSGGTGGGLYNIPVGGDGAARVSGTAFIGNRSGDHGGAIFNSSKLSVVNSTFSGNVASHNGGAIRNVATARFNNATFFANQGGVGGGNLSNIGTLTLSNSVVAGGTAPVAPDCEENITSEGYNLVQDRKNCTIEGSETGLLTGVDPMLSPLQDMDGGITRLHRPATRSAIVDAGSPAPPGSGNSACEAADQRGAARPKDGNHDAVSACDMGAAEIGGN
jgi:predicted outer membrane repeat protein